MNKILLSILLIFLLNSNLVNAQNPGYQGKKFILSWGLCGMPFTGAILGSDKLLDFNLRHTIRLEAIVRKNLAVGLIFEKAYDLVNIPAYSTYQQNPMDELANGISYDNYVVEFESAAFFNSTNYGFFTKLYNHNMSGAIAPLGSYFSFEFLKNNTRVFDDGRYYNNGQVEIHEINTKTFVLGTGFQNVFYNRITVDLSLNCGINSVGMKSMSSYENYLMKGGSLTFRDIERKMFSNYIIYTKLSVGVLLF